MIFLIYITIQTVFFSLMTQNSFVRQIAVIYSLMWTVSLIGVLRMVLRSIKTSAISLYSMANFLIVFLLTTNLFILLIFLVCLLALILLGQTILVKNFYRAIKAFILSNVLFHITFHFLLNSCSSILVLKLC